MHQEINLSLILEYFCVSLYTDYFSILHKKFHGKCQNKNAYKKVIRNVKTQIWSHWYNLFLCHADNTHKNVRRQTNGPQKTLFLDLGSLKIRKSIKFSLSKNKLCNNRPN